MVFLVSDSALDGGHSSFWLQSTHQVVEVVFDGRENGKPEDGQGNLSKPSTQ